MGLSYFTWLIYIFVILLLWRATNTTTKKNTAWVFSVVKIYMRALVSISSTFYEQLLCTKVFFVAFLYLQFGVVIFKLRNTGAKTARKMLLKLTKGCMFMLFVRPNCSTFPHSKLSNSFGRRVFVVSNDCVVLQFTSCLSDDYLRLTGKSQL